MKQENIFPLVPRELLTALEETFPKQDFGPGESLRELDYHFGQRSVIRFKKRQASRRRGGMKSLTINRTSPNIGSAGAGARTY